MLLLSRNARSCLLAAFLASMSVQQKHFAAVMAAVTKPVLHHMSAAYLEVLQHCAPA